MGRLVDRSTRIYAKDDVFFIFSQPLKHGGSGSRLASMPERMGLIASRSGWLHEALRKRDVPDCSVTALMGQLASGSFNQAPDEVKATASWRRVAQPATIVSHGQQC